MAADSRTETYVALQLAIDNWRWAGVPFYLRTGKHLSQRWTEIAVCFKRAPAPRRSGTRPSPRSRPTGWCCSLATTRGISLQFEAKRPGLAMDLAPVKMDFRYDDWFAPASNVGYETLLYDVMIGDPTLFMRADMVEDAWRIVQPVLDAWAARRHLTSLATTPRARDGPADADALIGRDGHRAWRPIGADPVVKPS